MRQQNFHDGAEVERSSVPVVGVVYGEAKRTNAVFISRAWHVGPAGGTRSRPPKQGAGAYDLRQTPVVEVHELARDQAP